MKMIDWLNYRAQNNSDDIFVRFDNQEYSFQDINNITYDRALALTDFGVKKNDRVAIFLSSPLDFLEFYSACYKINAISVILNYQWKENELRNALEIADSDYIICNWADKKLFTHFNKQLIFIEELSKSFGSCFTDKIDYNINQDNIQSILFTSGSQGLPKPVCLTYQNFYSSSMKWEKAIGLNHRDQHLLCLSMHHISGLAVIMRSLHLGFSININMNIKTQFIEAYNNTVLSAVPTLMIDLINDKNILNHLKKMRCIIISGANVSEEMLEDFSRHKLNIFLSYGMTETCSSVCGFWPLKNRDLWNSVGIPFEGVNITIMNNKVVIESDTVMKNYFNDKETNGIFKTFDKGEIRNNHLILNGRADNLIISGGENIDQNEVMKALSLIGSFDKVVPFKKEDSYWGEINGIYIYTNEKISPNSIKSKLERVISKHKIPKEIIIKKTV